jgi:hypothetical protein
VLLCVQNSVRGFRAFRASNVKEYTNDAKTRS